MTMMIMTMRRKRSSSSEALTLLILLMRMYATVIPVLLIVTDYGSGVPLRLFPRHPVYIKGVDYVLLSPPRTTRRRACHTAAAAIAVVASSGVRFRLRLKRPQQMPCICFNPVDSKCLTFRVHSRSFQSPNFLFHVNLYISET